MRIVGRRHPTCGFPHSKSHYGLPIGETTFSSQMLLPVDAGSVVVVGGGGVFGVGRDEALLLKLFVGLLGCQLLGGLDGEFDCVFVGGAVYFDTDIILSAAFFSLIEGALDFEADFFAVFLPPIDEFAFEVPFGMSHGVDIEVDANNLFDDDAACEAVAFFEIDGTHQGFKSVAVDRFEDAL